MHVGSRIIQMLCSQHPTSLTNSNFVSYSIVGLGILVWFGASGVHNAASHWAIGDLLSQSQTLPIFLVVSVMIQLAIGALISTFQIGTKTASSHLASTPVWYIGTLHFITSLITNSAYAGASVVISQSIKATEPLFVLLLSWISSRKGSNLEVLSVSLSTLGVVLLINPSKISNSSNSEYNYMKMALIMGLTSNLANAIRSLAYKKIVSFSAATQSSNNEHHQQPSWLENKISSTNLPHMMNISSFFASIAGCIVVVACWPSSIIGFFSYPHLLFFISASSLAGIAFFAYNLCSFWILSFVTVTSHAMIKSLKRPVIVLACLLLAPFIGSQIIKTSAKDLVLGVLALFIGSGIQILILRLGKEPSSNNRRSFWSWLIGLTSVIIILTSLLYFIAIYSPPVTGSGQVEEVDIPLSPSIKDMPFELHCLGIDKNLGDVGVRFICQRMFTETAKSLGMKLSIVGQDKVKNETAVVFGGGSLLNADWAMNRWKTNMAKNNLKGTHWEYPFFFFGGGYDDNKLEWINNRTNLESAIQSASKYNPSTSSNIFITDGISVPLRNSSTIQHLVWPYLTPNLRFGGSRGPISAIAFTQMISMIKTTFPVSQSILGDSGIFVAKYVNVGANPLRFSLASRGYVLIIVGGSSDGAYLGYSGVQSALEAEYNALKNFITHLTKQGYDVVITVMHDDPQDAQFAQKLYAATHTTNRTCIQSLVSLENLLAMIKDAHVVVSHKLHGGIFAGALGTPFISIAYRLKHFDWALSIQSSDLVVHMGDLNAQILIEKFDYIIQNRETISTRLLRMVEIYHNKYLNAARQYLLEILRIAAERM